MKILLINHYASVDSMEHRPFHLAKYWARRGHDVHIVAASFSHLRRANRTMHRSIDEQYVTDGVTYHWLRTPRYDGNGYKRFLNILTFLFRLFQHIRTFVRLQPNVVIASSTYPLDIFPAYCIARLAGAKLVFEIHDLWPLTLIELNNFSKAHPFIVLLEFAARFAYRKANHIVSILPDADRYISTRGMTDARKYVHIPNGIDIEEWAATPDVPLQHKAVITNLRHSGSIVVGYIGSHGGANALDTLLETAKLLRGSAVQFVLIGDGPHKAQLVNEAARHALVNMHFLPSVDRTAVPALLQMMDVLFIGFKHKALYQYGVSPNKLMEYMMAARPIVYSMSGKNDLVADSGGGITVPADDAEAVSAAILKLVAMTDDERTAVGERGREYVRERHDYKRLADKFLEALA